jgi:sterol desaturase/sphingolipid hydroxylase (fatty acid hydroxylase superfamily)
MNLDPIALEGPLRLGAFLAALALLAVAQWRWAARGDSRLQRRQAHNLGLILIDTALLRLAFPVLAVAFALQMQSQGFGLLHWVDAPFWLALPATVLLLDVAIYWQHRLMHAVPILWRMHRVHHSDLGFDLSTGVRFHPFEMLLSMGIKLALIAALGADPWGVLIFELLLSLGSLFTHTDIALPRRLDRALRTVFVTPSMHRIHHSVIRCETDSNYGFHLSLWDRLFRSYTSEPASDERRMPIGLETFREPRDQTLLALLLQPFRTPDDRGQSEWREEDASGSGRHPDRATRASTAPHHEREQGGLDP